MHLLVPVPLARAPQAEVLQAQKLEAFFPPVLYSTAILLSYVPTSWEAKERMNIIYNFGVF